MLQPMVVRQRIRIRAAHKRRQAESWADLLRTFRARGLKAPELAVGDGAHGFWEALRAVPNGQVREQRYWVHKTATLPPDQNPAHNN